MSMQALTKPDDVLEDVAQMLYGDGAWEIIKAWDKDKARQTGRKVGYYTNMAGMLAGPAAVALAIGARKEGGMFRTAAHALGKKGNVHPAPPPAEAAAKMPKSFPVGSRRYRLSRWAGQKANILDRPVSRKAKVAAGTAGGAMIGLQSVNWLGDTTATQALRSPKKKEVHKGLSKLRPVAYADEKQRQVDLIKNPKQKLTKVGVHAGFATAKMAPEVKAELKRRAQQATVGKSVDITWTGEISKMDTDKRQIFGWASIVEMNGQPVVDMQNDIMTLDVIEKAAYDYVRTSRKGGNQHAREGDAPKQVSEMVESFIVTPEKREAMGLPDSIPTGWWVGFQIEDPDTWAEVKTGKKREFSLHGTGIRKEVEIDD